MAAQTATPRPSEARDRLLMTAAGLFYNNGVHAVGVDEIISRAQTTRSTFYRHFPSKDELIVSYLRLADQQIRDAVTTATSNPKSPDAAVRAIANFVAGQVKSPEFRGCAFLKAAAEYSDPADPIHQAILAHRTWFHDTVLAAFKQVTKRAHQATAHFVMLRDGAMAEGCLSDPKVVAKTFLNGIDGMLQSFSQG